MSRIAIAMIIGGGVLAWFGFQEFRVASGTSSAPQKVELADLENGEVPENPYVRIGEHTRLYPAAVLYVKTNREIQGQPPNSTKVEYTYYPIISASHPFIVGLDQLAEKHGGLENVPDEAQFPPLDDFEVVVKTKKFKTYGAVPDLIEAGDSIEGLIINRIASLDDEDAKLLTENFPAVDVDKLIILEEDRKPMSAVAYFGMMLGGAALIIVGIFFLIGGKQGSTAPSEHPPSDTGASSPPAGNP